MIKIFYNNSVIDALLQEFNNRLYVIFNGNFLPIKLVKVIE